MSDSICKKNYSTVVRHFNITPRKYFFILRLTIVTLGLAVVAIKPERQTQSLASIACTFGFGNRTPRIVI